MATKAREFDRKSIASWLSSDLSQQRIATYLGQTLPEFSTAGSASYGVGRDPYYVVKGAQSVPVMGFMNPKSSDYAQVVAALQGAPLNGISRVGTFDRVSGLGAEPKQPVSPAGTDLAKAVTAALDSLEKAYKAASALSQKYDSITSIGRRPDEAVRGAYKTALKLTNDRILPLLRSTADQAKADPKYALKWLATAKSAQSSVEFISKDAANQGTFNATKAALQTVADAAEDALKATGNALDFVGRFKMPITVGVVALIGFAVYRRISTPR